MVPITTALADYLRTYYKQRAEESMRLGARQQFEHPDSLVFPLRPDAPQTLRKPGRVTVLFHEAAVRRGFHGLRFHDLRQSFASVLISAGANVAAVSARLGHSDISLTLRTYTHLLKNADAQCTEIAAEAGL